MESTRAVGILNHFLRDESYRGVSSFEKFRILNAVNKALDSLSFVAHEHASLIGRVKEKRKELNPQEILTELVSDVGVRGLGGLSDSDNQRLIFDFITSGSCDLEYAHLNLIVALLNSSLYQHADFPKLDFLKKIYSLLKISALDLNLEQLESFLKALKDPKDLFLFTQSLEEGSRSFFIKSNIYLYPGFRNCSKDFYDFLFRFFLKLSTNSVDLELQTDFWEEFDSVFDEVPSDRKEFYINFLIEKPVFERGEYMYFLDILSDLCKTTQISFSELEKTSMLCYQSIEKGRDFDYINKIRDCALKKPDLLKNDFFHRLNSLDKELDDRISEYFFLFLEMEDPSHCMASLASLGPPDLDEKIYEVFVTELRKNETFRSIIDMAGPIRGRVSPSIHLDFLRTYLEATSVQKKVFLELTKYQKFWPRSLVQLNQFFHHFSDEINLGRLEDVFKITSSIAISFEEFSVMTGLFLKEKLVIEKSHKNKLFDFMLGNTEMKFSLDSFPLFMSAFHALMVDRIGDVHLMLINTFVSLGINAKGIESTPLWLLSNISLECPKFLLFLKEKNPEEQNLILRFPHQVWKDIIRQKPILWESLIECYKLFQENLDKDDLDSDWDLFCKDISELTEKKQILLTNLIINFSKDFDAFELESLVQLVANKKITEEIIQYTCLNYRKLYEAGISSDGLSYFLDISGDYFDHLHPQFIDDLVSLTHPIREACFKYLKLLIHLPNTRLFLEFLYRETSDSIDERIFEASFKTLQRTPAFAFVCKAVMKRSENPGFKLSDKLYELSFLILEHKFNDRRIECFLQHPNFANLSFNHLSKLFYNYSIFPSSNSMKFFMDAMKLSDDPDDIRELARFYPFVSLTDRVITRLKGLSKNEISRAILFLSFIPAEKQEEYLDSSFNLQKIIDLSAEILDRDFKEHFKKMLRSTNRNFVFQISEFLHKNFIYGTRKISSDSELGMLIVTMLTLSRVESLSPANPFILFEKVKLERRKDFLSLLPYQTLGEETVALNLGEITKEADEAMINWTYDDLQNALGRPPIFTKEIQSFFQGLRDRAGEQINRVLTDRGSKSLQELEHSLCADEESSTWHREALPGEKASEVAIMFNACFSFLYSKLAPPLDSTSPLSESEMALLDFIGIFKYCGPGRIEQLRTLYEDFKSRLPKKFQELRRKKDDLRSFLYESYRDILENFLKENRELFRALHGKLSNVHESDYLKNLLGKRLGLLNVDDVTFDISTECIHSEIIEKNSSELFRFILNRFTPEMLVLKMQQKLIRLLEEEISAKDKDDSMKDEAPMGSKLGSWLGDFLTGSKMGWYYDMSVEMADPDPSKELLSKELIQKILIYAGLLEKREEGSITIYKSYVSVGVDELGRLRK
jgi:hypothetical protein